MVVYHLVPTSNHNYPGVFMTSQMVVYHLVPTSNHNLPLFHLLGLPVVYHLVPTSNHNVFLFSFSTKKLFIILFLHQTTTYSRKSTGNQ